MTGELGWAEMARSICMEVKRDVAEQLKIQPVDTMFDSCDCKKFSQGNVDGSSGMTFKEHSINCRLIDI